MQKGKVLSLKNFKVMDFVARNNILTIFVVLIAGGIAVGIFTQSKIQLLSEYSAD